jgi:Fur family ferric uptake transcriptional regulator
MTAGNCIKNTRQRDAIESTLAGAIGPLTVAEVHAGAKSRAARLGIATVYRALKELTGCGRVRAVLLPDGEARYELTREGHHHHFHCRACARTWCQDFCPVGLPDGASLPSGFLVESHELVMYGLCRACAVKPKPARKGSLPVK